MGDFQLIEFIFLTAVAVFVALRLRQVLGRRTGNERRPEPLARESITAPANVKNGEPAAADRGSAPDEKRARIGSIAPEGSALNQALTEIQLADRSFDVDRFLSGARAAYQMIVEAFNKGDKAALRPLLDSDVHQSFSGVIDGRAARGETVDYELVGIKDARITGAKLEGRIAEITVTFEAEIVSSTKNGAGAIIAGDPTTVVTVIDIWSFTRDVKSKAPDWTLSGTDTTD